MKTDFREYTIREAAKAITAIEVHLKQSADDAVFCNECVQKHFLEVQKFGEEGSGFFPEHKHWWEDLERWARDDARRLTLGKRDQDSFSKLAVEVGSEARPRRKSLIRMLEAEIAGEDYDPSQILEEERGGQPVPPEEMSDEEAHDLIFQLAGLDEATLEGMKAYLVGHAGRKAHLGGGEAYLVGHAGRKAHLGCLGGCEHVEEAELGAIFADQAALDKAKKEGCTCYEFDTGGRLCFAKGGVGALNKQQASELCTAKNTTVKKTSPRKGIGKRVVLFRKANEVCRINARAGLSKTDPNRAVTEFSKYTSCMSNALKKGKVPKKEKAKKPSPKVAREPGAPAGTAV
jgi:hypothetical protein